MFHWSFFLCPVLIKELCLNILSITNLSAYYIIRKFQCLVDPLNTII